MTDPLTDERTPTTAVAVGRIDVVRSRPVPPFPGTGLFAIPLSVRIAVSVWVALLVGVGVRVLIQPAAKQSVIPIYLTGGERWLNSEPLYPPIPGLDLYRNPPGVAALFAPLSLLPAKPAAILWRLACVAVYLIGVRSLVRDLLPPLAAQRRAVVWVFAAVLALPAINNGQINLMIAAAALVGAGACARGSWWTAAGWLAFAGWLKVYPLAVGLLCVLVAPRQLGWRLAVMCAVLFALPFVLQHPAYVWDRHVEFVQEMRADDRTAAAGLARAPRDWTVLPRLWFDAAVPRVAQQGVAVAAAAGLAAVVLRSRGYMNALLLGLLWIVLFGPATESNTYAVLAPAAGAVAVGSRSKWVLACGWVAGGLLLAAVVRGSFPSDAAVKLIEVQPVAAGVLLVGALGCRAGSVSDRRISNSGRSRSRLAEASSHPR